MNPERQVVITIPGAGAALGAFFERHLGRQVGVYGIAAIEGNGLPLHPGERRPLPIIHFGLVNDGHARRELWEAYKASDAFKTDPRVKPCDWRPPQALKPLWIWSSPFRFFE